MNVDEAIKQAEIEQPELDTDQLLVQILIELQELNKNLSDTSESEANYTCENCNQLVAESNLQSHGESCFNYSPVMGEEVLLSKYE